MSKTKTLRMVQLSHQHIFTILLIVFSSRVDAIQLFRFQRNSTCFDAFHSSKHFHRIEQHDCALRCLTLDQDICRGFTYYTRNKQCVLHRLYVDEVWRLPSPTSCRYFGRLDYENCRDFHHRCAAWARYLQRNH